MSPSLSPGGRGGSGGGVCVVGVAGCGVDGNGGIVHINRAVDGWWIYMIVPQFGVIV